MSAVGIIGLAWAFITTAAFAALSASATARTRHELEADPWGSGGEGTTASEATTAWERPPRAPLRAEATAPAHAYAVWPAIEMTPASLVLRSSPSAAQMHATSERHGSVHLS
jgi:hypothetical protein